MLKPVAPTSLAAVLCEVEAMYAGVRVRVFVEGLDADRRLSEAFVSLGWTPADAHVILAHVGAVPWPPTVEGLRVERVTNATLREFNTVKLQGFADTDDPPGEDALAREATFREAEMQGVGRFLLARIDGEPASILAMYDDEDRDVFLLATRVSFRNRGIGTNLLTRVLREARDDGARSVVIGTNPDGKAIVLYRRLGFTDDVYYRRPYDPPSA